MSQYLVLSQLEIQNANSIAGLTWGFPAITQFLGFTHALNRKLSDSFEGSYSTQLTGCSIISHCCEAHVYSQEKGDLRFTQRKSSYTFQPAFKKGQMKAPSIIEEGKMNLTVSLVIELAKTMTLTTEQIKQFEQDVQMWCYRLRIAGGTLINTKTIKLLSASTAKQEQSMLAKIKRLTMPGFVLLDRSDYLKEHHQELVRKYENEQKKVPKPDVFDAWLDFSARKYKAVPITDNDNQLNENTAANWEYVAKPKGGFLVPLMTGYKAISDLYGAGEVLNTRDETTPVRFVEAIHSVGEWQGMQRTKRIENTIWRYHQEGQWYLCRQRNSTREEASDHERMAEQAITSIQDNNLTQALNLF